MTTRELRPGMQVQRRVVVQLRRGASNRVKWKDAVFLKFDDKHNARICYPSGETETLTGTKDLRW